MGSFGGPVDDTTGSWIRAAFLLGGGFTAGVYGPRGWMRTNLAGEDAEQKTMGINLL